MLHDVAVIDDHHLVRSALVGMLGEMGNYHVVLEAGNGKEMIDLWPRDRPPALAIVDLSMPVMDGFATIAWLREHAPSTLPLALTFDASDDALVRAVRSGARGFVLKSARPHVLRSALEALLKTGYFYSEEAQELIALNPGLSTKNERDRERILSNISAREMEFLLLVCDELEPTYEEIAATMGVGRRTVDSFRISLFDKFGIKSKSGLVLFAMRWKFI